MTLMKQWLLCRSNCDSVMNVMRRWWHWCKMNVIQKWLWCSDYCDVVITLIYSDGWKGWLWCRSDCDVVITMMQWCSGDCDGVMNVMQWRLWCSYYCDAVFTVMQLLLWCSDYSDAVITVMQWCRDYCNAVMTMMQLRLLRQRKSNLTINMALLTLPHAFSRTTVQQIWHCSHWPWNCSVLTIAHHFSMPMTLFQSLNESGSTFVITQLIQFLTISIELPRFSQRSIFDDSDTNSPLYTCKLPIFTDWSYLNFDIYLEMTSQTVFFPCGPREV